FADVKSVMKDAGTALMGVGNGVGENRAQTAARTAISSPLLETSIQGAKGMLFSITGGTDLTMSEVNQASELIAKSADADANIIFGANIDEALVDQIKITVIATGFDETRQKLKELSQRPTPTPTQPQDDQQDDNQMPEDDQEPPELSDPEQPTEESDEFDIPAFLRQGR
ncbi:cell division protein FtsZ, partial [Patescibacteria group bacterium]